ncbi:hypothetical protein GGS24DRAFT_516130 [Hypoxylon argillaceum]|nr:hypothetical protein GGS24DRAFT_516130 [Hypoxylon argillaceum]
MNHDYSSQLRFRESTDVLWWDSTASAGEKVQGPRFDERLDRFKRDQRGKTPGSNSSIDVVILTEEPALPSERRTTDVGFSITRRHFNDLITTFGLPSSFKRWNLHNTGYHHYIKDNPSIHDESPLVFAARSTRLHNECHFLTMSISPRTNSTMCIITVPRERDREWLRTRMSHHQHKIMTCPVYLFNIIVERLDYNNEILSSEVFTEFEAQERQMDIFCRVARALDAKTKMYDKHRESIFKLNVVNRELMTLGCNNDFELSALGFAKSVMARYTKLCTASNQLPRMSDEELQTFDNEIASLQATTQLRQANRASAQQRAEHMVSLLRTANSQCDLKYSLEMAENSRKTSSQARSLTILASIFIPPSFIATVFGANIFLVNPRTRNLEVANGWWIPAAFAGGLTVVVLVMVVCIWFKKMPGYLKSRCPHSGSSKDAPTKPPYIPLKEVVVPRDQPLLPSGAEPPSPTSYY